MPGEHSVTDHEAALLNTRRNAATIAGDDVMRRLTHTLSVTLALAVLVGSGASHALADDPCGGFKWDVSKERALFGSSALSRAAGKNSVSAPGLVPNRLYQLQLLPASEVAFSVSPGKKPLIEGTYAGLAALKIPASGSYRISVDLPLWIDVAAKGKLVPAKDYEGQQGCDAPHKIVEFDLDARQPLLLQFSGTPEASVRLTVTRVLVEQ